MKKRVNSAEYSYTICGSKIKNLTTLSISILWKNENTATEVNIHTTLETILGTCVKLEKYTPDDPGISLNYTSRNILINVPRRAYTIIIIVKNGSRLNLY